METRFKCCVCIITLLAKKYHLAKDITVNCHRSGATSQTYTVPNTDNTAAGDYTCMVTVSTVASSDSSAHTLTATGILTFQLMYPFQMLCTENICRLMQDNAFDV